MKVRQVLTSSIFTLLLAGAAHAQTTSFLSGTSWSNGTWSNGVPMANSNAIIGQPGALVFFDAAASPSLSSLTINGTTEARFLHPVNNLTATNVTVGDTDFGRYEQSGGLLTATTLTVGNTGSGVYVQTGGSLVVTGNSPLSHLIIGAGNGGIGRFELSTGASVTANAIHVGGGLTSADAVSSGTFVQNGGTVNVTGGVGELVVGDTSGTSGLYEMKGGTLTSKQLYVGVKGSNPVSGERAFAQSGGTVTVSENLVLGGYFGGTATPAGKFTLTGTETSILNTSKVWVGLSGSGTFTQEGGVHNVSLGNAVGDRSLLIAAGQAGSEGVYNMKSGVLNAEGIYVGNPGKGTLNHTGGTINVSQQLIVDNGGTVDSLGKYVMTGGALNTTGSGMTAGLLVTGSFEHSGGVVTANGIGAEAGLRNDGTYTLAGGTLQGTGNKINNNLFTGFGIIAGSGPLINNGTMTFTGGNSTISSPVENKAGNTLEVRGNVAVFQGAVVNRGNFKTTAANVVFQSLVSNAGTFYSDPSLQDFQAGFHNIDNNDGTPGFITTDPDEGIDRFRTGADFHISTANFELWNTTGARLEFYKGPGNTTGVHSLIYAGLDYGLASDSNGYLGFQKNLSWAEVLIETGNILATGTEDGRALYTEKLIFGSTNLADILAQVENFSGDLKIYYDPADNPYLQEQTFLFGEGEGYIAPVPEPSAMLLAGIGAIALSFRRRRQA